MKKSVLTSLAIVSLSLSACGGGDKAEKPADATVEPAGSGELAQAAAGATGVAECDTYLTKVMACFEDKIPEAQRAAMKKGLDNAKAEWAKIPDKAKLAKVCTDSMAQAKQTYGAMGCTF